MGYRSVCFLGVALAACTSADGPVSQPAVIDFGQPVRVKILGYTGNSMEPFLSRDGTTLLFNNLNAAPENTNLHWAGRIDDTTFQYKGEISGVNTTDLEGVPTLDNADNLYFVSTRNYAATLATLYRCRFSGGTATDVQLLEGVSKLRAGAVNFDVEVSADGKSLYFVDSQFNQAGNPSTADLVIAQKNGSGFQRMAESAAMLTRINTDALEYGAGIAADQLELYFTRLALPVTALSSPELFVSTRRAVNEPFGNPSKIKTITGFAEAPTVTPDQKALYYHKKEDGKFVLYFIKKG